eukprot:CAMPEP_0116962808 /NCGR_PEP_ID=MMETSP0467-20121206/47518_1 /TAXON_ID=283647 /ORGANISM="Mesodinium pulex, Strain SPMC105" /LENGTH=57 /DNA_ID=CAMNT_0004651281 /DNA_START=419 /DNA_END=592 /DNA_ORIENTATION=+
MEKYNAFIDKYSVIEKTDDQVLDAYIHMGQLMLLYKFNVTRDLEITDAMAKLNEGRD